MRRRLLFLAPFKAVPVEPYEHCSGLGPEELRNGKLIQYRVEVRTCLETHGSVVSERRVLVISSIQPFDRIED